MDRIDFKSEIGAYAGLCMVVVEEAFIQLAPDLPCVLILRVSPSDLHMATTVIPQMFDANGITYVPIIDKTYNLGAWSLECRDKQVYSEGA